MPGSMQYWFMRRLGAEIPAVANLMSLRDVDILATDTVTIGSSNVALPPAPAGTTFVVFRNAVSMRAIISATGRAATAADPLLPAIAASGFSNLSQISAGEILCVLEAT